MYLEFLKKSFLQAYVYRINTWLNLLSALISIFIQINLWSALLKNRVYDDGVSLDDMLTFVLINTILRTLTQASSGEIVAEKIRDGSIAIDFLRPIELKYYVFAEDLGKNLYKTIFSVLPVSLLCIALYQIHAPNTLSHLGLFLISVLNGIVIMFYIYYIFALFAFWLHSSWYLPWYVDAVFKLFGGTFVPLWFYPENLARLSHLLPFKYVTFEPVSIYLGRLSLEQSTKAIGMQLGWILVLWTFERMVWRLAEKKVIVQGG